VVQPELTPVVAFSHNTASSRIAIGCPVGPDGGLCNVRKGRCCRTTDQVTNVTSLPFVVPAELAAVNSNDTSCC